MGCGSRHGVEPRGAVEARAVAWRARTLELIRDGAMAYLNRHTTGCFVVAYAVWVVGFAGIVCGLTGDVTWPLRVVGL